MAYILVVFRRLYSPNFLQKVFYTIHLNTMLIGISIVLVFTMLFNVKFNADVDRVMLEDNNMLYYSFQNKNQCSKLTLDFSNVSSKVQRFALLKEDTICKESVILSDEDINNYELEMEQLVAGKYTMKITTADNIHVTKEIEVFA